MKKFSFFRGYESSESPNVISYAEYHRLRDQMAEEQYRINFYKQMMEREHKPYYRKIISYFKNKRDKLIENFMIFIGAIVAFIFLLAFIGFITMFF